METRSTFIKRLNGTDIVFDIVTGDEQRAVHVFVKVNPSSVEEFESIENKQVELRRIGEAVAKSNAIKRNKDTNIIPTVRLIFTGKSLDDEWDGQFNFNGVL